MSIINLLLATNLTLLIMVSILFFKYKSYRKKHKPIHLDRYRFITAAFRSDKLRIKYEHFVSSYDKTVQGYTVFLPRDYKNEKSYRLIYFFHGMDGDSLDASVIYELVEKNDYIITAGNFRGPAWVNKAVINDMVQLFEIVITKYSISDVVLFGISMGGSQALTFGAIVPERIKNKMAGIISFMGAADYIETYRKTSHSRVRKTIEESFGGPPEQRVKEYETMSAVNNLEKYPSKIPFAIIYRSKDKIIPTSQQRELIAAFQKMNYPVYSIELPGDHLFEPVNYQRFFDFIDQNLPGR